jgi:hypothetical protein
MPQCKIATAQPVLQILISLDIPYLKKRQNSTLSTVVLHRHNGGGRIVEPAQHRGGITSTRGDQGEV